MGPAGAALAPVAPVPAVAGADAAGLFCACAGNGNVNAKPVAQTATNRDKANEAFTAIFRKKSTGGLVAAQGGHCTATPPSALSVIAASQCRRFTAIPSLPRIHCLGFIAPDSLIPIH